MRRMIREERSAAAERAARARACPTDDRDARAPTVRRLARNCRGDLDWIVMKALEKDRRAGMRRRRLRGRHRRYLSDQAVDARPPSAAYRI